MLIFDQKLYKNMSLAGHILNYVDYWPEMVLKTYINWSF